MQNKGLPLLRFCLFIVACAAWFASCDNLAGDVDWPSYTVVYHANDGTYRTRTYTYRHGTDEYLNGNMFDREGHTIKGWATTPEGEVRATYRGAVNRMVTSVGQVINLYAVWLPNTYSVVYHPNGGEGEMEPSAFVFGVRGRLQANAFTNEPNVFHGWARSPVADKWEFGDQAEMISLTAENAGVVTLHALWGPQYLTIIFDANGGDGVAPQAQEIAPGSNLILPGAGGLSREGHYFLGWNTDPLGESAAFAQGDTFTTRGTRDVTLYATWSLRSFTVTFDANGADGTPPYSRPVGAGMSIILPGAGWLSMQGHTFGGWSTEADDAGQAFAPGENFTPTGNVTLYAVWHPIGTVFTVTFDANNGSGTPPNPQTVNAGNPVTIPGAGGLSMYGYNFGGWNTETDGTGRNYAPGSTFMPTGDVTLYANWIPIEIEPFSVTVEPFTANVPLNRTRQFTHTVRGPAGVSQNVTWTVRPETAATIAGGLLTLTGATVNQELIVTAAMVGDPTVYGYATVTVTAPEPDNVVITQGTAINVERGIPMTLAATVEPAGAPTAVTWSIATTPTPPGVTLTSGGMLTTVPPITHGTTFIVRAEATGHPNAAAFLAVTVNVTPNNITMNPHTPTMIRGGESQQFTATVEPQGVPHNIVWSVSPQPAGVSISQAGLLTVGGTAVTDGATLTVTATIFGTSLTATATVTVVVPPASITVTPGVVDIPRGETRQFESTVGPTGAPQNVEWTVATAPGGVLGGSTINQQGLLTIGAYASGALIVRATVPGTDISDTATVNVAAGGAYLTITLADLRDPLAQDIQGPNINLRDGGTGTITVVAAPGQPFHSITWLIGARPLTIDDGVSAGGATLTVGYAIHGNRLGTHRITVRVEVLRDGVPVPYSRSITFEVGTWLQ